MEIEGGTDGNKSSGLATSLQAVNHVRQRGVGEPVTVVGKKQFLILKQMSDSQKQLANVAPNPCIHKCYAPIRWMGSKHFHALAEIGDNKIALGCWFEIQKVIFDHVRLVAKT